MISKIIHILLIVVGLASLGLGLPDFGGDVGIPMTISYRYIELEKEGFKPVIDFRSSDWNLPMSSKGIYGTLSWIKKNPMQLHRYLVQVGLAEAYDKDFAYSRRF